MILHNKRAKGTKNSRISLILQLVIREKMANPYFQFKQFTVWHDKCAMKVGTDGVLLGAWCCVENAARILDIGCGTGLISLMLAQRCQAEIDAVDIDESACIQARENADRSPFGNRLHVFHRPFANFVNEATGIRLYDCIVSNPPYFIDSFKCPDKQRNQARHTDTLSLEELIGGSKRLLAPQGKLCLILPFDQREILLSIIYKKSLFLHKETTVLPTPASRPKRLLVEISDTPAAEVRVSTLTIEKERHTYTDDFTALVKDYFLHL